MIRKSRAASIVEALEVCAVGGSRVVAVVDVNVREMVVKLGEEFRSARDENL